MTWSNPISPLFSTVLAVLRVFSWVFMLLWKRLDWLEDHVKHIPTLGLDQEELVCLLFPFPYPHFLPLHSAKVNSPANMPSRILELCVYITLDTEFILKASLPRCGKFLHSFGLQEALEWGRGAAGQISSSQKFSSLCWVAEPPQGLWIGTNSLWSGLSGIRSLHPDGMEWFH